MIVGGWIAMGDIPTLCSLLRAVVERTGADLVVCDVGGLADPDAVVVEALARLQLTARRLGGRVELRGPCDRLQELLLLTGLGDLLPVNGGLPLEPGREAEQREQALGVQEEADPGDLPV